MNRVKNVFWLLSSAFSLAFCLLPSALCLFPCTDFILKSQDGACVVGRSMEFGEILPVQIQIFNKGIPFQSTAPNYQKKLSWISKYSYIGIVFKPAKAVLDGFNERGLSFGALWMPGTQYPNPEEAHASTLFFADLGAWLLGNFATVDEAKTALSKIQVWADKIPGLPGIAPLHLSIHDASGKSAVVEFLEGVMRIDNNPIGVLTNAPEFPWHLTNLRNYLNLTTVNAQPVTINGTILQPTGQGSGLKGIPGDWTPPSRFVRTAFLKQALITPKDAEAAVLAAIHLLNSVDIPYGVIRLSSTTPSPSDFTQWIVVKDLANKALYYRTYADQNIQMINFNHLKKVIDLDIVTP